MRMTGSRRTFLVLAVLCGTASIAQAQSFSICHGYGCTFKTKVSLTAADQARIASIMAAGRGSAQAERSAVRRAVQVFERRNTQVIGVIDRPKMDFGEGRQKGQMDCVDESTNTDHFLRYLQSAGLLRFHTVDRRDARGMFIDGRYPHFTAVLRDRSGTLWVVDSWFEPGGGLPDVMRLAEWKVRGVGGAR
ncbi:hypothetical protein [Phyllobacterium lublinensis]|jgi:hypothetical protein|uniref:hypothetical protein n=1 Tax=Phyllobacterium lublinensis TaxID=2875708 RepID=UPI001CCA7A95|nr:hypothetical protein [Phyllobacterium sp. 2063]MBZ9653613.1 hypothetical protein [Phyllobacterium sp. 2063]